MNAPRRLFHNCANQYSFNFNELPDFKSACFNETFPWGIFITVLSRNLNILILDNFRLINPLKLSEVYMSKNSYPEILSNKVNNWVIIPFSTKRLYQVYLAIGLKHWYHFNACFQKPLIMTSFYKKKKKKKKKRAWQKLDNRAFSQEIIQGRIQNRTSFCHHPILP